MCHYRCYEKYFRHKSCWWHSWQQSSPTHVSLSMQYFGHKSRLATVFVQFLCGINPQQVIQDASLAAVHSKVLVCSSYHSTVVVASNVWNWLFVSRECGYVWANHSSGLPYDKIIIIIVEHDTWETSLIHCRRYCYECEARVTILGNELVIFPGTAFYYGNNYIVFPSKVQLKYRLFSSSRRDSKWY